MSDRNELLDRIEEVIWKRTTLPTDITVLVAQAIIDEFGLTVERRDTGLQSNPPGRSIYVSRVVGKWEKQ